MAEGSPRTDTSTDDTDDKNQRVILTLFRNLYIMFQMFISSVDCECLVNVLLNFFYVFMENLNI